MLDPFPLDGAGSFSQGPGATRAALPGGMSQKTAHKTGFLDCRARNRPGLRQQAARPEPRLSQEAGPGWSGQPQGRTRRRGGRGRARTGADGGWGGPLGGRGREEAWALVGTEGREQTALPRARGRGGDLSGCGDRVSAPEGPQGALGSTRDLRPSAVDGPRPQGAAQGPPGTGLLGHPGQGRRAGFSGR